MQNKENNVSFEEEMFENFKSNLKEQLNIKTSITDEEINQSLIYIIKQYELKFKDNFSELFLYDYYYNLLNTNFINKIINFVKHKEGIDQIKKDAVLKEERKMCNDILNLYALTQTEYENTYVSDITNMKILLNSEAMDIINNDDIFFRKPKGKKELMGPHALYTYEYNENYWINFKENIKKYQESFPESLVSDLEDYHFWLTRYHTFNNFLNNKGGKHVKN